MASIVDFDDPGNASLTNCYPDVQPPVTASELDELFGYMLRDNQVFCAAHDQLAAGVLEEYGEPYHALLWDTTRRLVDRYGDDTLPANLEQMLRSELQAVVQTEDVPETLTQPLFGYPPNPFQPDAAPQPGLLDRIFSAPLDELQATRQRGLDLIGRVRQDSRSIVESMRNYLDACGDDCPTPASLSGMLHSALHQVTAVTASTGFGLVSAADLARMDDRHEWLVDGILVAGEPCILGGPKKSLKTSFVVDLAISLGCGPPVQFLNRFEIERRVRVGLFSGESGQRTLRETAQRVARSKDRRLDETQVVFGFRLPRLSDPADLLTLAAEIRRRELQVVILDPLYLCLLSNNASSSATNLFDMGPLLLNVAATCLEAGATPILVHHATKSSQYQQGRSNHNVPELENLAFAGIQEFARQWMLLGRRERYDPDTGHHKLWLNVGGSAGFSGVYAVDVTEGQLQHDFSGRTWQVSVRTEGQELESRRSEQETTTTRRQHQHHRQDREAMERALLRYPDGETLTALRDSSGLGGRARAVLDAMVEEGVVQRTTIVKGGGRAT